VLEQTFRQGRAGALIRPFSKRAEVECRSYSGGLQRVMVDFGAEESFGHAVERVREPYGVEVPRSAVRTQTEEHGARRLAAAEPLLSELGPEAGVELLITEMDGSMVRSVLPGVDAAGRRDEDRRKSRHLSWQEARRCLAREPEKVTPRYGACLGNCEQAGAVWADCVIRAGAGAQTDLHCLGDGARWIPAQAKERFGEQATYLCEFYHVSDYVAAAGEAIAGAQARAWLHEQQARLKENQWEAVLDELRPCREPATGSEEEAPVRACFQYLDERRDQLDYRSALAAGLPIGSGEIESAHRSVIQERLKLPGAWWLEENARKMPALRVTRANGEWQTYWTRHNQGID
jgi:hypothetical protein